MKRVLPGPSLARAYFALQALAVVAWWGLLAARPDVRPLFRAAAAPDVTLLAFAPGDLLLLGLGSAAVAFAGGRHPGLRAAAWTVAGATVYGAIYTVTLAVSGAAGPLGAAMMTPAAVASVVCARALDHV